jgi:hypothetical protein
MPLQPAFRLVPFGAALCLFAMGAAGAAAGPSAPAPPPNGYYIHWPEAREAPPEPCDPKQRDFTCSIERTAAGPEAARLLAVAEALYPPRDVIAEIAERESYEIGADTVGVPLWWSRGTGPRRVPYAATRGALDYFLSLTRKYRDNDYRIPGAQPMFSSEVVYRASIERRKTYEVGDTDFSDVYVARIAMSWTFDDGTFIPLVTAHRTVVLSPRGDVLSVHGDGEGIEDVTFSTHRGMGRSTELRR